MDSYLVKTDWQRIVGRGGHGRLDVSAKLRQSELYVFRIEAHQQDSLKSESKRVTSQKLLEKARYTATCMKLVIYYQHQPTTKKMFLFLPAWL